MRRFSFAASACAFALAGSTIAAFAAEAVAVPLNVKIAVVLTQQIDSGSARVGETFGFKTQQDLKLGDLDLPAGTPGTGRLAIVQPAAGKMNGNLALQADSIELPDGRSISVNIDPTVRPQGHLTKHRTIPLVIPIPGAFIPGAIQRNAGDIVLDPGAKFQVVTVVPRRLPAPLLTAPPMEPPGPASAPNAPVPPSAVPSPAAS